MSTLTKTATNTSSRLMLAAFTACMLAAATGSLSTAHASQYAVSKAELRDFCARFDFTFWVKGPRYGCGEQIECSNGHCRGRQTFLLNRQLGGEGGRGGAGGNGANGRR